MPADTVLSITERLERKTSPAYSVHLDFVRGLAAIAVFGGHLRYILTGHTGVGAELSKAGNAHALVPTGLSHDAVIVFFVLSGYLVGGSAVRDIRASRFRGMDYAAKRLSRLWTVLVPAMAIGCLFDWIVRTRFASLPIAHSPLVPLSGPSSWAFFGNLLFLQDGQHLTAPVFGSNVPLWSLSYEFWYYVFFPLLAVAVVRGRTITRVVCLALAMVAMVFVGSPIVPYFVFWLLGVVGFVAPATIPARFQRLAIGAGVAVLAMDIRYVRAHAMHEFAADASTAVAFTLLLYALLHRRQLVQPSPYSRLSKGMSLPSYTLYVFHVPAIIFFGCLLQLGAPSLFRHIAWVELVVGVVTLVYAAAMFFLFERNTDAVRRLMQTGRGQR